MKKMSKAARSNLLNGGIIVVTLAVVLYVSAKGGDIGDAWRAVRSANPLWILAAIGSWCVFMIFEAMGLHVFFHQQKVKIKFGLSQLVALIGAFYSSVTPAATGGQPMQVLALKRRNIPAGVSSSGLAVKFFSFQTALLSLGGLMWILNPTVVQACIDQAKWIVLAGFVINGLTVAAVILLAINKNIVHGIITLIIRAGKALRLVKNEKNITARADKAIGDFHASVDYLTHHPVRLFHLYLISCLQVLGLMSIAYCIYRALGLNQYTYWDVLTLQFLLYIAASFTPLPGASGAQEGGFYIFFQHVFPADKLVGALLLWRFFTYYFTMIVGLAAVIYESVWSMRRAAAGGENKPAEPQGDGGADPEKEEQPPRSQA
ncbi:MAG: flippase-like domain-containing protein [Clostridia bacterium]|nr:flippase-like domain-containing protein [Clostridia bacterium]